MLADGTVLWGRGIGATGRAIGEVCFNTSMTGYQEIMTDPSYAGQIVTFTFPHIGNVGANPEDLESTTPAARGCVLRDDITDPSNWRATRDFDDWPQSFGLIGISGVDTRALTRRIRDNGAPNGVRSSTPYGRQVRHPGSAWPKPRPGLGWRAWTLAKEVSTAARPIRCRTETRWAPATGYGKLENPQRKVVAIDFGAKRNILR